MLRSISADISVLLPITATALDGRRILVRDNVDLVQRKGLMSRTFEQSEKKLTGLIVCFFSTYH